MSSTSQPIDVRATSRLPSAAAARPQPHIARGVEDPSAPIDPQLVAATQNQIRALAAEVRELATKKNDVAEYFAEFLSRVIAALGAVGGAVWLNGPDNRLTLQHQVNLAAARLQSESTSAGHARLLQHVLAADQSTLVPPHAGSGDDRWANPSEHLLLFGILRREQTPAGLVEVVQRPGAGPTTQRGYQRFVEQMCDLAGEFLLSQRVRELSNQNLTWQRIDQFTRSVHRDLNESATLYALANEGRRVVECDRVSVSTGQGGRQSIRVVSGLDSIERRGEQIKLLSPLVGQVVRGGQPLWYTPDVDDLPPQIEQALQRYIDCSHVKSLAIVPLRRGEIDQGHLDNASANSTRTGGKPATPCGALICEQLNASQFSESARARIRLVAEHGGNALSAAIEHQRIFLLPLWQLLGSLQYRLTRRRAIGWLAAGICLLLLIASVWSIPYPFALAARGELVPKRQHEIFAPIDGILEQILVPDDPEAVVPQGQLLARLSNNEILVEIEDLEGQLNQWTTRHQNLTHSWSEQKNLVDKLQVERDLSEATAMVHSLQRQLEIKRGELQRLELRAPVAGRVVNWQVRQSLLHRPVTTGQNLLTVVEPDTEWELELLLPERRVSHLVQTARQSDQPLQVQFSLASLPGKEFRGTIAEFDSQLAVAGEDGNCLKVRVAFDPQDIPDEVLKAGTRATAQIQCGRRQLGYVWFRELIETVHAKWLLWF